MKYYARQWERYTNGATYVNKLFNYLNKHWVKREKDEGRKEVYAVYTVCQLSSCEYPQADVAAVIGGLEAKLLYAL